MNEPSIIDFPMRSDFIVIVMKSKIQTDRVYSFRGIRGLIVMTYRLRDIFNGSFWEMI
jgi:hypothetical protein